MDKRTVQRFRVCTVYVELDLKFSLGIFTSFQYLLYQFAH